MRGFEDWTEEDVKKHNSRVKQNIFALSNGGYNKYKNEKTIVDGVKFDSKKEARNEMRESGGMIEMRQQQDEMLLKLQSQEDQISA